MNILYILQQSIYDSNNKWRSADSNINMMVGAINEILHRTKEYHFYILIGNLKDFGDIQNFNEIIPSNSNVHFVEYNFPVDAFLNRQHFNVIEFDNMFSKLPKIDIVWNNITEISRNIKTYLVKQKSNAKLITTCYWLDTPEIKEPKVEYDISYQYRQFDGFLCSDLCVFTCESTKQAFFENAEKIFSKKLVNKIKRKQAIWDFGFSTREAYTYYVKNKSNKKTILFLNRLSGINYTHHEQFIRAVNKLYEKRQDFQVVFTNPSGKYTTDQLINMVKPFKLYNNGKPLSREQYFKLLWESDVSFHGFLEERYGGCSFRESLFCGNITVTPKVFEYERILGNSYKYYTNNKFTDLDKVLDRALDAKKATTKSIYKRNSYSSFEVVIPSRVLPYLDSV